MERDENAFWDVLVVRRTGQWFGFRAPWKSLQRVTTLLALLFLVSAVAGTGWLVARWQLHRSVEEAASLRLSLRALRAEQAPVVAVPAASENPPRATWLPGLDGQEILSSAFTAENLNVSFDATRKELSLKFGLRRAPPVQGAVKIYWILLLHGAQGVLSLPPALANQTGDAILFHRGQSLEDLRLTRDVTARFNVGSWMELAGSEPVYSTLLVYDDKGSLLIKTRQEIQWKRGGS